MTTRVGPMVATLARARGLTIGQLALATGIHRNRLADKIAGRRAFTEGEIVGLAEALGTTPARLFENPLTLLVGGESSTEKANAASARWTMESAGHRRAA